MAQLLLCMKKSQFPDSPMDQRLSFPLKRCGFESSFIFSSFLLICLFVRLYSWFCVHMDIFFESCIRLFNKYTQRNVNKFNKPKCNNSLTLGEFNTCIVICWLFFKINFFKSIFQEHFQSVNGLYLDQDRRSVGTDIGSNCLQKLSTDNKSRRWQEKSEKP